MSIALSEFWTRLVRSGIADAEGCKKVASAFTKANSGMPPGDAQAVARFMVKRGDLTRFQARAIFASPPRELRAGNFLIRSDQTPPPLGRWLEAARIDDGRTGLLFHDASAGESQGFRERLQLHQTVNCPTLQPLDPEFHAGSVLVFSVLPDGACLSECLVKDQAMSAADVCRLGIAIADALESLHAAFVIHGQVRADRVWVKKQGGELLLRDPSVSASSPQQVGWLDQLESSSLYVAPESHGDQQVLSIATDIYSLGCLLFRLATGSFPFHGKTESETAAAHRSETPPELSQAITQGESGDPLLRVIAFAMAKNPASRFASAAQLSNALKATATLLKRDAPETVAKQTRVEPATPSKKASVDLTASTKSKSATLSAASHERTNKISVEVAEEPLSRSEIKKPMRSVGPNQKAPPSSDAPRADSKSMPGTTVGPAGPPHARPPQFGPAIEAPPEAGSSSNVKLRSKTTTAERPSKRRRKRKSKAPLVLGALCVACLLLVIGLMVADDQGEAEPPVRKRRAMPTVIPPVNNGLANNGLANNGQGPAIDPPPTLKSGYDLVSDERLLFAPPYPADSMSPPLDLLPPGPAVIVTARLSSMKRDPAASELLDGISPELADMIGLAADRTKVSAESIKRLTAALHPDTNGWPEVSLMVQLEQAIPENELASRLKVGAARTTDGATIQVGEDDAGDAYFWKSSDAGLVERFAIGSISRISEVAAIDGSAIPLPRTAQSLWNGSSDESDLVVLFTPNFLFADGRELLGSSVPELVRPLRRLMQPDVATALISISLHDRDRVFVEAMFAPSGGISEAALMRKIADAVASWPKWADEFILNSDPDPSWRLLATRLPSMLRFVESQVRFGVSDGRIVANAYLPSKAFPQVALATALAMNTRSEADTAPATVQRAEAMTVEQILDREMSVSFDQESLEFALEAIVDAFTRSLPPGSTMPPARIVGGDLQLMGITQNQQVRDFAKTNLPLRTVLTDLVLGANSDKTATGPSDPKQTLIWVVSDDPANPGQKEILITTRQAAQSKRYEMPREFIEAAVEP